MTELLIYQQDKRLFDFPLTADRTIIGRASDCDLILAGETVSRHHARIEKREGGFWIADTSSTGTRKDGTPITAETRLTDGAVLELGGHWRLVYRDLEKNLSEESADPTRLHQESAKSETQILQMDPASATVRLITPQLLVEEKNGTRHELILRKKNTLLGTGTDCDVRVSDPFVSKHHVEAKLTPQGLMLVDLGSTNGTWLDGTSIREGLLKPGQEARIGQCSLQLKLSEEQQEELRPLEEERFCGMIGASRVMRLTYSKLKRVAPTDMTVLILGESGTGKELAARAVHDLSPRRQKPFVVINCAAISPHLVESELFGHEKGAFTSADQRHSGAFEQANGGTLFLDEIGELPLDLQAKILRALEYQLIRRVGGTQEIRIDVRLVAATHRHLVNLVAQGKFREDLFYRLYVVPITLPPLRERREDIPLLIKHFCQSAARPLMVDEEALNLLTAHEWPGNVRELRHTLTRAMTFCRNDRITRKDIEFIPLKNRVRREIIAPTMSAADIAAGPAAGADVLDPQAPEQFERERLAKALQAAGGNKDQAAQLLGMGRSTFFRKIKELGIACLVLWLASACAGTHHVRTGPQIPHVEKSYSGVASWYGRGFHGRKTASGERYNMHHMTAAHKSLPFGTWLSLTNPLTRQSATVRVNDRGPFVRGRELDVSFAAAKKLGLIAPGSGTLQIEVLSGPPPAVTPVLATSPVPAETDIRVALRTRRHLRGR